MSSITLVTLEDARKIPYIGQSERYTMAKKYGFATSDQLLESALFVLAAKSVEDRRKKFTVSIEEDSTTIQLIPSGIERRLTLVLREE